MGRGHTNPVEDGRFNLSSHSPLGVDMVMGKYIGVGNEDGEGKICLHPTPNDMPTYDFH